LGAAAYVLVLLGVGIESLGVPVPGELTLLVGVVVAGQGRLSVPLVALFAWIGAVVGDNLGYLVGRRWGRQLAAVPVLRKLYTPERMARADRFFERLGWLAVFAGRFVALLRIFAGPLAGMHRMPWRRFVLANATGGALWIAAIVLVGLVIAHNLDQAVTLVGRAGYVGLAAALLAVVALITIRIRRRR
jgi:membrane protein DedA with SNARE-associated domain